MLFPNSTEKGMRQLMEAHGITVKGPTVFTCVLNSAFLRWRQDGKRHSAYLATACGQPYLSVDGHPVPITLDEVIAIGLLQEK